MNRFVLLLILCSAAGFPLACDKASPAGVTESKSNAPTSAPAVSVAPSTSAPVVANEAPAPAPVQATPENYPFKVVELRGDGTQMGEQHGKALGKSMNLLFDKFLSQYLPSPKLRFLAMAAAMGFEQKLLPEHLAEIQALAKSSGMSIGNAMLGQCFLDLTPMTACSTVTLPAYASPDHIARFGRNLDFPSFNVADKYSVLFIYHPAGRYQFAAVGWPGLTGVLSGMNEHGLCLANMEVNRAGGSGNGMPYILLYRAVLERCKTVDEAIDFLQKTPRQTPNNLMLMDAAGNRAVCEITPKAVVVRHGESGAALISTNHQRGQDYDTAGRCWRFDYLHDTAAAQYGKIDLAAVESFLAHVVQGDDGDMTLQSMVFEPANRVLYLTTGSDAPSKPFVRIDLKSYFQKP